MMKTTTRFASKMIPVSSPSLDGSEQLYLQDCIQSGWISSDGPYVERFEREWADYCGAQYGIAVSSGTAALQIATSALELGPGDEVILPSFTIISCILAVLRVGATPVLVDCDPDTYCMDVDQVADAITCRTRAIMPVHLFGHPVQMDPLLGLAEKKGLYIIEDAAQAHGSEYRTTRSAEPVWKRCGSLGTLATFSFYANKLVTTGEGGMLLTDDPHLAERCRSLRNLCFQPRRFYHEELGHNFRITNMQAAIGVGQLEHISSTLERKRAIGKYYNEAFADLNVVTLPAVRSWARTNYGMYPIVLSDTLDLDASTFAQLLRDKGVETRPLFLGLHEQPVFRDQSFSKKSLPVTEYIHRRGLYLPSGSGLTRSQLDTVANAVTDVISAAV